MRRFTIGATALIAAAVVAAALPAGAQPYDDGDGWGYHPRYDGYRPRVRHFCWYESGWHGRGSYWCGYAWRVGYGWAGGYEGDYEHRGLHYRGYWEDGTGRRFYDRGGYGVGHCDYGGPRPWSC